MSRTKSPNLELFSERTSSIYRNVKLKDRASFFSFFLRNPLLTIFLYWKLHNWLTPNMNALKKMMQYWLIDWLLFNSVKWGLFQQYACQEQVYEQCIMKVNAYKLGRAYGRSLDCYWKKIMYGNDRPGMFCLAVSHQQPLPTRILRIGYSTLLVPYRRKPKGTSFRFCPSVRPSH